MPMIHEGPTVIGTDYQIVTQEHYLQALSRFEREALSDIPSDQNDNTMSEDMANCGCHSVMYEDELILFVLRGKEDHTEALKEIEAVIEFHLKRAYDWASAQDEG